MSEPSGSILLTLRGMRAEKASLQERTRVILQELGRRFGTVEAARASCRNAATADMLTSRLVTGEFEKRIGGLERRVRELEKQH